MWQGELTLVLLELPTFLSSLLRCCFLRERTMCVSIHVLNFVPNIYIVRNLSFCLQVFCSSEPWMNYWWLCLWVELEVSLKLVPRARVATLWSASETKQKHWLVNERKHMFMLVFYILWCHIENSWVGFVVDSVIDLWSVVDKSIVTLFRLRFRKDGGGGG